MGICYQGKTLKEAVDEREQLFKQTGHAYGLEQLDLVEEVHFDETHHHYEAKPSAEHHHLVCLGCGRVVEFNYPLTRLVKRKVTEAKDFEITSSEVKIAGYCPKCRQERK